MSIKIPYSTTNFLDLRQGGFYYVDKTGFLEQLLQDINGTVLFTRPRRFGKTLAMSMMAEFFDITKDNTSLFAGLKITENKELCEQWMNQYPVIFLSLKDTEGSTFEEALAKISRLIAVFIRNNLVLKNCCKIDSDDKEDLLRLKREQGSRVLLQESLLFLSRLLFVVYGKPVILLIDEYDVPVAKAHENGYYDDMITFIRGFLSAALKDNSCVKFAILTGCLHLAKESIVTGLNTIRCYDISETDYADMFGFTNEEVDTLLEQAEVSDKKALIKEWYDGYLFGENQEIYCPFSIMNYVKDLIGNKNRVPKSYWIGSSANEVLQGFVTRVLPEVEDGLTLLLAGKNIAVEFPPGLNYTTLYDDAQNFWLLLYFTGYLTSTSDPTNCVDWVAPQQTILTLPNKEVREGVKFTVNTWFKKRLAAAEKLSFFNAFWKADAQACESHLSDFFLKHLSSFDYHEAFYHAFLFGLFCSSYGNISAHQEAGFGRYDLCVLDAQNNRGAIIEVKRAESEEKLDEFVEQGLRQSKEQQYDVALRIRGIKTILLWSMAYYQKKCTAKAEIISL